MLHEIWKIVHGFSFKRGRYSMGSGVAELKADPISGLKAPILFSATVCPCLGPFAGSAGNWKNDLPFHALTL
jgi:hypothetical protein